MGNIKTPFNPVGLGTTLMESGGSDENPFTRVANRPQPRGLLHGLGSSPPTWSSPYSTIRGGAFDSPFRSRSSWNDRFSHWQRPASDSEEATIARAQDNVKAAILANNWLSLHNVQIERQGSYHNNTNVRREADVDLRAEHPVIKLECASNISLTDVKRRLEYTDFGMSFEDINRHLRRELTNSLVAKFGRANVDASGTKAIKVKGVIGSRVDADVVPAIGLHYVNFNPITQRYDVLFGKAILSTDNQWTYNFPEHHLNNGVSKRARTQCRYKKIVRIFKRLRFDMTERGILDIDVPSFLVESLVYAVDDEYFLVVTDDWYARVRRIACRIQELLYEERSYKSMTEANEIKLLFHPIQKWTLNTARRYIDEVVYHLGDV